MEVKQTVNLSFTLRDCIIGYSQKNVGCGDPKT